MQAIPPSGLIRLLERLSPESRTRALTHRSWARSREESYERLEFLGDAVLSVAVTGELLTRFPDATEGDLAWMRQQVVGRDACAEVAERSGLMDEFVRSAPNRHRATAEQMATMQNVRADVTESVIGAIWQEIGPSEAIEAVLEAFTPVIDRAKLGQRDAKTALQELAAKERQDVHYELVDRDGPAHERVFTTRVLVGGEPMGIGVAASKQASEQAAAAQALHHLEGT